MDKNFHVVKRSREIIELLMSDGLVDQEKLDKGREESKRTGLRIEVALQKLGYIKEEDITRVQAAALDIPYMDLTDYVIDGELIKLVPEKMVRKFNAVPLFKIGETLSVGMLDPQDILVLDQIRKITEMEMVEPILVSEKGIQKVLESYYSDHGDSIEQVIRSIDEASLEESQSKGLQEIAEEAPIIKLVNVIIQQAVNDKVSDIHIEPELDNVRVRCRTDGILYEVANVPKNLQNAVISRIKILSRMDIAENRKPQDGRIRMVVDAKDLDIRVSTFPTVHGENVVMRLLDKSSVLLGLEDVGFQKDDLAVFDKLIRRPNGIIFVTGPTGSGKTTTLYTALMTVNSIDKNIKTIEDPVEYELPLIRQTQVNPKAGITFSNGLRSILRQDPDIIMVGEIRDKETADVAIQASLTGHLVLATLHTNDAPSSLSRLVDMGVEPFLISSSTAGIVAQRLVRVICPKCIETYEPSAQIMKDYKLKPKTKLSRGKGCSKCKKTGYTGRIGIFEILEISKEIRELVEGRATTDVIRKEAKAAGMKTLFEDGMSKVLQGLTTLDEVLRVTIER